RACPLQHQGRRDGAARVPADGIRGVPRAVSLRARQSPRGYRRLAGTDAQQRQLDSLAQLIRPKLIELDRTIWLRRQGKVADALRIVASGEGRATMDGIRRVLGNMQAEEWSRIAQLDRQERSRSRITFWVLGLGGLAAIVISFLLSQMLGKHGRT